MAVILVIIFVFFLIILGSHTSLKQAADDEKVRLEKETTDLKENYNFSAEHKAYGSTINGFVIDPVTRRLAIRLISGCKVFKSSEILEAAVITNGQTITKTSRGSQIGGAIVGGVLTGGVGAIIGGLSGKKTSVETITEIKVRIVVKDINNPIYDITVLQGNLIKDPESISNLKNLANTWYNIIRVFIEDTDPKSDASDTFIKSIEAPMTPSSEILSDIERLSELRDKGILTEEEFTSKKKMLLDKL